MIAGVIACALLVDVASATVSDGNPLRTDYLTFAQGVITLEVGGDTATRGVGLDSALAAIDGNPGKFALANKFFTQALVTEFTYELPALTTFDRFAVPDVFETPSPSQTFAKSVEVLGSSTSATDGFVVLAKVDLTAHNEKGTETELAIEKTFPVRWIKLRIRGGIDDQREEFFEDFSEIIGNGTQEVVPLATAFDGVWKYRANLLELKQDGPRVTGCYDAGGDLEGAVTGRTLRAMGVDRSTGVPSAFVVTVNAAGEIRGVRSTNGAPFATYDLAVAPKDTKTPCSEKAVAPIGCGSTVYGINFDFDSAEIRPESEPVLRDLFAGLQHDEGSTIIIEGHTSNEGSDAYNQALSERRAAAVVADLVRRGLDSGTIRAVGKGETEPLAKNDDEAGRSLNRRVEIVCAETP